LLFGFELWRLVVGEVNNFAIKTDFVDQEVSVPVKFVVS
jgi:hypothetical protein